MKRLLPLFIAMIVFGTTTISAESKQESVPVDSKKVASSQTTKSRSITPQGKTNWSKIKDIFM